MKLLVKCSELLRFGLFEIKAFGFLKFLFYFGAFISAYQKSILINLGELNGLKIDQKIIIF